jgi:hypothetical protein
MSSRSVNANTTLPRISPMLVYLRPLTLFPHLDFTHCIYNLRVFFACRRERPTEKFKSAALRRLLVPRILHECLFILCLSDDLSFPFAHRRFEKRC